MYAVREHAERDRFTRVVADENLDHSCPPRINRRSAGACVHVMLVREPVKIQPATAPPARRQRPTRQMRFAETRAPKDTKASLSQQFHSATQGCRAPSPTPAGQARR